MPHNHLLNESIGGGQPNTSFIRVVFLPKSRRYLYLRRLVSVNMRDTQGVLNDMDAPQTLLEAVRRHIRTQHLSYRTERAYLHWIRRYL